MKVHEYQAKVFIEEGLSIAKELYCSVLLDRAPHVCSIKIASILDNKIRTYLQNPQRILEPYIKEGMTVLDMGCGTGFFSIELAEMVGDFGQVIAADLQEEMLQKLRNKIKGTKAEKRIKLHKCEQDKIGVSEHVDFVFACYMVHEVPNKKGFFSEIKSILTQKGLFFIIEPKWFHVSKKAFEETIKTAREIGFEPTEKPKVLLSQSVILRKG